MDIDYQTVCEPMTHEHVLAVFRDQHRQQCHYDPEAEPCYCLSAESSVADWRNACDLVNWRELGHVLNSEWGIDVSDSEWYAILEPPNEKRLNGVAAVIAAKARCRSIVQPANLLGATCTSAGAFLTIRSLMLKAGADATTISPSTPLAAYTRQYPEVFLGPISRLAPGALPAVSIHTPIHDAGMWTFVASLPLVLIGWLSGLTILAVLGIPVAASGWLVTWIATKYVRPASVRFGELKTFRDLASVVSGGPPNQPMQADDGFTPAADRHNR